MGKTLYLTPPTLPTTFKCRRLRMPDDPEFFAAVQGALLNLVYTDNWVQGNGVSTTAAAAAAQAMYDECRDSLGECMTGQVVAFAGAAIPAGFLDCDGSTHLRTDWPNLYATLDAFFIVDADHFTVPDLRGRSLVGVGTGSGLTARAMGDSGGEESHTLITAELASHTHLDAGHSHVESGASPSVTSISAGVPTPTALAIPAVTGLGTAAIQSAGSDAAHNTMHPFFALRYIIQAD